MRKSVVVLFAGLSVSRAACAADSPIRAWGTNSYGELGVGDTTQRETPTVVPSFTASKPARMCAGYHSLAVTEDGALWAWGRNSYGQLGLGDITNRTSPTQVSALAARTVTAIAAGLYHTLAATSDNKVWACGRNSYGQLGLGDTAGRQVPTEVPALTDKTIVALGASNMHSLAVTSDGKLWTWGANSRGQLGLGYVSTSVGTPTEVTALSGFTVTHVIAGFYHSLARTPDGKLWAWGSNSKGQLGLGDTTDRSTPTQVTWFDDKEIACVAAGCDYTLVATSDGKVWAFGWNYYGQLGLGDNTDRSTPVQVAALASSSARLVAAGFGHSIVSTSDGTTWTFGANYSGQLGLGDLTDRNAPAEVSTLAASTLSLLAAGDTHSLVALKGNAIPVAHDQAVDAIMGVPKAVTLTATDGDGDPLTYSICDGPAHGSLSGTPPEVIYTGDPEYAGPDAFTFAVHDGKDQSAPGTVTVTVAGAGTSLWTAGRTGTITELVTLRQYDLKRTTDNALLAGKTITFRIDGTAVGTSTTDAGGDSILNWTITDGPATRTIVAEFAGDAAYNPSSASAALTCQSWATKMVPFARSGRITDRTELKAKLLRSDNVPLYGKPISFYVDGTFIITRNTNTDGYASHPYYDIPDGAGAGVRTILSEWVGNGGYAAVSKTADLTVLKAIPYIWVLSKSVPAGGVANLYAYFRRLYDYRKQEGKPVTFTVDGTWVADVTTGVGAEGGVARHLYPTSGLGLGVHKVRCEFAGDAWVDAGFGEGNLTIL